MKRRNFMKGLPFVVGAIILLPKMIKAEPKDDPIKDIFKRIDNIRHKWFEDNYYWLKDWLDYDEHGEIHDKEILRLMVFGLEQKKYIHGFLIYSTPGFVELMGRYPTKRDRVKIRHIHNAYRILYKDTCWGFHYYSTARLIIEN